MSIFEAIRKRRAIRDYQDKMISDEHLDIILEAARLSPSSKNSQPVRYVVIKDKNTLEKLASLTHSGSHLPNAPVGIAVFTKDAKMPEVDATRAIQNMVMVAWELGIGTCWITNYNGDMSMRTLNIPTNGRYQFITCMPFGYIKEGDTASGSKKRLERSEIVSYEKYDQIEQ